MRESKLDIRNQPERFGMIERARYFHNAVCDEFKQETWKVEVSKDPRSAPPFFGSDAVIGAIQEQAFLEGLMLAVAFCSGSVSGGFAREFTNLCYPELDAMQLTNFMGSVMQMQTLWEQNPEPLP